MASLGDTSPMSDLGSITRTSMLSNRTRQVQFDAPADAPELDHRGRAYSDSPRMGGDYDASEMAGVAEDQNASVNDLLIGTSAGFFGPKLLLFGCLCGILGFVLVVIVMVTCQIEIDRIGSAVRECGDFRPVPASVSELVHRWDTVSGRIFFGLEFLAGLCIFLSAYGFCFKNSACDCYVDFSFTLCGRHFPMACVNRLVHEVDLRWCDMRMFVPPVGYMLVCLVPTIPIYKVQGIHEFIMIGCHCCSAFMMFLGLMACEYHFWSHHVDYADPDREFEAKTMAELRSTTPAALLPLARPAMTPDRLALAFPKRAPGQYTYYIGYKELFCRRIFNLGNVVFFLIFIAFQVLLDVQECAPASFVTTDLDTCSMLGHGCEEVANDHECKAANAMLIDDLLGKQSNGGNEVQVHEVPVNYPPCQVASGGNLDGSNYCHGSTAQSGLPFTRDLPFGCYLRTDDRGAAFYWNSDKENGKAATAPLDAPTRALADAPNRVCKCGKHRKAEKTASDSTVLDSLFEPKGRTGNTLHGLMEFLMKTKGQPKLPPRSSNARSVSDGLEPDDALGAWDGLDEQPNGAAAIDMDYDSTSSADSRYLSDDGMQLPSFRRPPVPAERRPILESLERSRGIVRGEPQPEVRRPEARRVAPPPPPRAAAVSAAIDEGGLTQMAATLLRIAPAVSAPRTMPGSATEMNGRRGELEQLYSGANFPAQRGSPLYAYEQEEHLTNVHHKFISNIRQIVTWEGVRCGACEIYTIGAFLSEVVAGLCSVWLHLIIWFFCEERFLHTKDRRNTAAHACQWNHRSWRRAQKLAAQFEEDLDDLEDEPRSPGSPDEQDSARDGDSEETGSDTVRVEARFSRARLD